MGETPRNKANLRCTERLEGSAVTVPDGGVQRRFSSVWFWSGTAWQRSGLRRVASAADAVRSKAGVTLASEAYRSEAADAGDGSQVPPAPGEVPSGSWLPSGERCGGHPEPCEGLCLWSGHPVLLGAEASRRSDRWSEGPFSATQQSWGSSWGAYHSHGQACHES